jgi:EmrB/QacA subfamily drug resistance transporter
VTPTAPPDRLPRETLVVGLVVTLGSLMSILDATIVNVALQTIAADFGASLVTVQWIVSGYTLALGAVIPLSGWASDRYGARTVWLAAVGGFVATSVLCGLAWSVESLIMARAAQGVAGGLLMPVGTVMIARSAGPGQMGRVMSVVGVPMMLGPVLGPIAGGLLIDELNWRWVFFVNVPVGALAALLGVRLLPADGELTRPRIDVVGVLLLSPASAALIWALTEAATGSVGDAEVLLLLAAGLALLAAFVLRSLRSSAPLLDIRLFTRGPVAASAATTSLLGLAVFSTALLLPLYFQLVRQESVLTTGALTAVQGIGMAVAMPLAGRYTDRLGAGRVAPFGIALAAAGLLGLSGVSATTSYWTLASFQVLIGLGMGASMMPAMSAAYESLEPGQIAQATSGLQMLQRLSGAFGSAAAAVVLQARLGGLAGGDGGGLQAAAAVAATPGGADAVADAFGTAFALASAAAALALLPALTLRRRPPAVRGPKVAAPDGAPAEALAASGEPVLARTAAMRCDAHPLAGNSLAVLHQHRAAAPHGVIP